MYPLRQSTNTECSKNSSLKTKSDTNTRKRTRLPQFLPGHDERGRRESNAFMSSERRRVMTQSFEFCRLISTPRLKGLLPFHLAPINVVISHESITIPYLGAGFPLRCFQRLSNPDIATGQCTWRYSPQTRGQFISVLSSFIPRFLGAQTISSPVPGLGRGRRHLTHTSSHPRQMAG